MTILITACATSASEPGKAQISQISFDQRYVAFNVNYVSDEVIGDDVIVFLNSVDARASTLSGYTEYSRWYTGLAGKAVLHNSMLSVPSGEVEFIQSTLPYGGVATP